MALNDPYAELDDLRDRLDLTAPDATLDAILERALRSASRAIDKACGRVFYQEAAQTRTYTAEYADYLAIDDLVSVTTLKTDEDGDRTYETTWLTTDYDLTPDNATLRDEPYLAIRTSPNGVQAFPTLRKGVQIVGTFGWPAIPDAIVEACLILANRYVRRAETPLGFYRPLPDFSATMVPMADPDVAALLDPFRRFAAMAV